MDVLCINRYYGWYEDTGHLDTIPYKLTQDLDNWYKRFQRPIIITEYGADTVSGLHTVSQNELDKEKFVGSSGEPKGRLLNDSSISNS